ncbi:MAG: hypothetical protein J1F11_06950 [Oscillospiraceae bacterium]|nr:hypothetical protein [Oscillospiraceae bacterium]
MDSYAQVVSDSEAGERCRKWISQLEGVRFAGNSMIHSKFNDNIISVSRISTSCKTFINILLNPETPVFIGETGRDILSEIFKLPEGALYSPYEKILYDRQFDKYSYTCVNAAGEKTVVQGMNGIEEWYNGQ